MKEHIVSMPALSTSNQYVDPLEYLVRLGPRSLRIEAVDRQRKSNILASASGKPMHVARSGGLVGCEHGGMLKGLRDGPREVAYYRMTYSSESLQQLELMLSNEAAALAAKNKWRIKKNSFLIRLSSLLAISEKYNNVCKVCNGSSYKRDRKPCKSCQNGFTKRTQRECSELLGMDHKNYARIWKPRVEMLITVLDEWEDQARKKIAMNTREYS